MHMNALIKRKLSYIIRGINSGLILNNTQDIDQPRGIAL